MKYTVLGIAMAVLTVLVMAAVMVVSGRSIRQNEVDRGLNTAAEQTVENGHQLENEQQFLSDLAEGILYPIGSNSEMSIQIAGENLDQGLLTVTVSEQFQHPNGKPGKVETEQMVILEKYSLAKKLQTYTIVFQVNNMDYKIYTLMEGSKLIEPAVPDGFQCWMNEEGNEAEIAGQTAEKNRVFTAGR